MARIEEILRRVAHYTESDGRTGDAATMFAAADFIELQRAIAARAFQGSARLRAEVDRYRAKYIGIQSEVADLQKGYEARCKLLHDQWVYSLDERVKLEKWIEETGRETNILLHGDRHLRAEVARYRRIYIEILDHRDDMPETVAAMATELRGRREWAERAKLSIERGMKERQRLQSKLAAMSEGDKERASRRTMALINGALDIHELTVRVERAEAETRAQSYELDRVRVAMYREAPCQGEPEQYIEDSFEGEPLVIDDDRCFTGVDGISCQWNRGDRCEVSKVEHLNQDECPLCGRSDPHVHEEVTP